MNTTDHTITVSDTYSIRQGTMFRPTCSCGWEGDFHPWYGTATLEGTEHTNAMTLGRLQ